MSQSEAGYERLNQQMQSLELQASEQITLFKRQQERLEQRQQELALHSDSEDEESAEQNAAANEVKEQARLLDDSQVSLAVAFAQLRAARTNQEIGNVLTDKRSFALVGIPERSTSGLAMSRPRMRLPPRWGSSTKTWTCGISSGEPRCFVKVQLVFGSKCSHWV
jgi:hypothetical protein